MAKLTTIKVTRRSDGETIVINEIDFNPSLHEKISASKRKAKPLAETDTRTQVQKEMDASVASSQLAADAIRAENEAKSEPLAETPTNPLEEIEAELNQLHDDQGWQSIKSLAEEHGLSKEDSQTYRDLIPAIAAKLHEVKK